jgi:hypothetical protein
MEPADSELKAAEPAANAAPRQFAGRKMADHPHWWTVTLSAAALVISLFSLYETRIGRRINEASSRASIQVKAVKLLRPWKVGTPSDLVLGFEVSSVGKSVAEKVLLQVRGSFFYTTTASREANAMSWSIKAAIRRIDYPDRDGVLLGDMGPGLMRTDEIHVSSPTQNQIQLEMTYFSPAQRTNGLQVIGRLQYSDAVTGEHTDNWCFYIPVPANAPPQMIAAGEFKSCDIPTSAISEAIEQAFQAAGTPDNRGYLVPRKSGAKQEKPPR